MATPSLPTYALIQFDGFAEQREPASIRTEMESGPPRQAKIKSRVMVRRPVSLLFKSRANYQAFIEWFSKDLNEGNNWFSFLDPVSGTNKTGRFVSSTVEGKPLNAALTWWSIKLQIEVWGS